MLGLFENIKYLWKIGNMHWVNVLSTDLEDPNLIIRGLKNCHHITNGISKRIFPILNHNIPECMKELTWLSYV